MRGGRGAKGEWTVLGHKRVLRDERRRWLDPLVAAALAPPPSLATYLAAQQDPPPDWRRLFELAQYHGVASVLFAALDELDSQHTPPPHLPEPPILEAARRQDTLAKMPQRVHQRVLATLLAAFAEAQLKVVALKGPVLAERYWGGRDKRHSSDLDFLVAPAHFDAAAQVLEAHGYVQSSRRLTWASRWRYPDVKFAPSPEAAAGAPLVELHWIAAYGFGTHLDTTRLLARARPYTEAGSETASTTTWILEPCDEFLALAIHGAKHQYERLAWLIDLVYMLRTESMPREELLRRAHAAGAMRVLAYTAAELKQRLGLDLLGSCTSASTNSTTRSAKRTTSLRARVERTSSFPIRVAQRLANHIHGLGDYRIPTKLWRMAFHLTLAQSCSRQVRYLAQRLAAAMSRLGRG